MEVTVQEKSSKKTVKVTIDNHQYELKVPTISGQQAEIKVNGELKRYKNKEEYETRKEIEEEKESREYQLTSKNVKDQEERRKLQRQENEFAEQKKNFYQDKVFSVTFVSVKNHFSPEISAGNLRDQL